MKNENILSERIYESRKAMKLTQEELAKKLSITPQSVSRWENGQSRPDIDMLPKLAAFFGTTIDSLFGYHAENLKIAAYEKNFKSNANYQRGKIKKPVREILGLLPPTKPVSVLVMGCTDDTPIFLARNGYIVSAFDISEKVLDAAKNFSEKVGVEVNFFRADVLSYKIEKIFDIICVGEITKHIPKDSREKIFEMMQKNTSAGGLNVVSTILEKSFSKPVDKKIHTYHSAEIFGYYGRDWKFELMEEKCCEEKNFCFDYMIARKF